MVPIVGRKAQRDRHRGDAPLEGVQVVRRPPPRRVEEMVRPDHLVLPDQKGKGDGGICVPTTSEELKEIKKHLREKAVEEVEKTFVINAPLHSR